MIRPALLLAALAVPASAQDTRVRTLEELAADIDRSLAASRATSEPQATGSAPGTITVRPLDPAPPLALAPPPTVPPAAVPPTPDAVNAATYAGGDLPEDAAALTVKVQVLLDRAGISPGVVDGVAGGMSVSAIQAFEDREGLPVDGVMDAQVWAALGDAGPVLVPYVVTADDHAGLSGDLPADYADLATLPRLDHERVTERLAERFHMDEDFLVALNGGFAPGETIWVADPGPTLDGPEVARIEVRKAAGRLAAFDAAGAMVANYPVTVGSDSTPSPSGVVEVVAVALDPTYHYDPANFVQGENTEPLTLPPGPNGPVGSVWIDLSQPSYGLHGTPNPSGLFQNESHGCVRLTNWDAQELAGLVRPGTVVEFIE